MSSSRTVNQAELLGLTDLEQTITTILDLEGRGGLRIGELLAQVQDETLWRAATATGGEPIRSFEGYLATRALEWTDQGMRASKGSLKRWLSHYRVFGQALGLDFDTMRSLGTANMDELRKVIDYDERTRAIGPGQPDAFPKKLSAPQARQVIDGILAEAAENDGSTFFQATKEMVQDLLGRIPRQLEVVVATAREGRYRLLELIIWQGGNAARPAESMDEDTLRWLTKKYGARLTVRQA
ncbi:MAG: hypothetical protein HYX52_05800 [Chloroflexi bacterium]|nr:hypothetical protein [Chloroflexota bacterium]